MKEFEEKREQLERLQAPQDLEERLRKKIQTVPQKKKRVYPWLSAVAILGIMVTSMNYQAIAYYGKTLFGYEELMSDSIKQLYEEGYGQVVNKEFHLDDGTIFTIEGIMSDRHGFEMYYSVSGNDDFFDDFSFPSITGFLTDSFGKSGIFDMNVNKGVQTFEPVSPFAKKLHLEFSYKDQDYVFIFPYDANKAVPVTLKKKINQKVYFDFGVVEIQSISATKGSTQLIGKIKEKTDRNISYDLSQIQLFVDGKEMMSIGYEMNSIFNGAREFKINYGELPTNISTLSVKLHKFNGKESVKQSVPPEIGTYKIGPVELDIISVEALEGVTKIRIASRKDTMFDAVWLKTDVDEVPLKGTEWFEEDDNKKVRTLLFETNNTAVELYIGNVYYDKDYGEIIDIPIK